MKVNRQFLNVAPVVIVAVAIFLLMGVFKSKYSDMARSYQPKMKSKNLI